MPASAGRTESAVGPGARTSRLLLGPLLRYVDATCATVWVQTDRPGTVSVLGSAAPTFTVAGHHYAIVAVEGLEPGSVIPYTVELDGQVVWPSPDAGLPEGVPPSSIRTPRLPEDADSHEDLLLTFGSCRVADGDDRSDDALAALAVQLWDRDEVEWPDALLLLGDQVYADASAPRTREFIRSRRDPSQPPGLECADFEEYARLYEEAWSEPEVRWLLSTVPSAMIFDDHDVIDDWNISETWVRGIRTEPWWEERIAGALMSYWIYQQLGNLRPDELAVDETLAAALRADDAAPLLRRMALDADRGTTGTQGARWSYARDYGRVRLLVIDSRNGRVLEGGQRSMLDDAEWAWLEEHVTGDFDHLLIASSVPVLLPRGLHEIESWNEAVCAGAWGRAAAWVGERVREAADFEHWAAFRTSFDRLTTLVREVAEGRRGPCPASVLLLSGDVHYAYLAEVDLTGTHGEHAGVYQIVCSPLRYAVESSIATGFRMATTALFERVGRWLARLAAVPPSALSWTITDGPYFSRQLATLRLAPSSAHLALDLYKVADGKDMRRVIDLELLGRGDRRVG